MPAELRELAEAALLCRNRVRAALLSSSTSPVDLHLVSSAAAALQTAIDDTAAAGASGRGGAALEAAAGFCAGVRGAAAAHASGGDQHLRATLFEACDDLRQELRVAGWVVED